jgi:uroporphyrin-III C-methyltransferase/precorrin-2 dehydrogenase/sirohydrochlorin ferrochelatase
MDIQLPFSRHGNSGGGQVFLVGAGPGDPDLLTLRALRLMQETDVVVYDALVSDEVMALVGKEAERIYVGKRSGNHALPQEAINALLIDLARQGKHVLRLKGGDPFVFGRGGEEIEMLAAHDIPFQVIPGISAANGISCYAGIPLTHRRYAQSVLYATGHLCNGMLDLDWVALTRPHQTVVIYMGLSAVALICEKLVEYGLPATHPIAVVQQGTTAAHRIVSGTLATIADRVAASGLASPSLILLGEVVPLHETLGWFSPQLAADPLLNRGQVGFT